MTPRARPERRVHCPRTARGVPIHPIALSLALCSLFACRTKLDDGDAGTIGTTEDGGTTDDGGTTRDGGTTDPDLDADGYPASEDCDDSDATVNPGATELCNDVDDDCDGDIDEDDASDAATWYADTDEGLDGSGDACAAASCNAVLEAGADVGDDLYWLEGSSGDVFEAWCDMTRDGGGWTLIGSVVNEYNVSGSHDRNWDSYDVWTDTTTLGDVATRQSADYKGAAFYDVSGNDYLMVTDEYAFGFYDIVGDQDFATFMSVEYTTSDCNTSFLASGADWSETLDADQASMLSFIVRPLDDNASCFPNGNETAVLGHQLYSCCWVNGPGNTPDGYPSWEVYDLSLLQLSYLSGGTCTAGDYPCNDIGYYMDGTPGYTVDTKVVYGEIYVR